MSQPHPSVNQPQTTPGQPTPQSGRQPQQTVHLPFPTDPLQANRLLILKELRRAIHEVSQSVNLLYSKLLSTVLGFFSALA
jgi:hypothetical protein